MGVVPTMVPLFDTLTLTVGLDAWIWSPGGKVAASAGHSAIEAVSVQARAMLGFMRSPDESLGARVFRSGKHASRRRRASYAR